MAHRKEPRPPASRGRGGLIRGRAHPDAAAQRRNSSPGTREGSIWGRRRVLLLNSTYEPLTALPMRRAVVMLMCGKADVVHDDPSGPVIHSATRDDRGAVGDPAAVLRAGALPRPHPDDQGRADAPRPVPLRLLRRQGRHRRPRGAAQPRRRPHLGELRGRAARRATTARPTGCWRNWAGRCARRRRGRRASTGGCCRRSRNSTRRGCDIWVRARPSRVAAIGLPREHRTDPFATRSGFRCWITLVLIALIWGVGKNRKGPHPATYKMSEQWTHEPILWAADEPADHGHGACAPADDRRRRQWQVVRSRRANRAELPRGFVVTSQRTGLRRHRARRGVGHLPVPGQGPGATRRRAEVRVAGGEGPLRGVHRRPRRRHRRDRAGRPGRRCRRPTTRCCWRCRRTRRPSRSSTARTLQGRGIEESAPLGVNAAAASFNYGNLMAGLIAAINAMSAGVSPA